MRCIRNTVIFATVTLAIAAPVDARERHKQVYSNVTAVDMARLFNGVALVSHTGATNKKGRKIQHIAGFTWFSQAGQYVECRFQTAEERYLIETGPVTFETVDAPARSEKYPLLKAGTKPNTGYLAVKYNAADAGLTTYTYRNRYWWDYESGHLQTALPAALWTACPDFPSAKSLGAKVNQKQTALHYRALIGQDKGQRIKRPDLVTEDTVEHY